MKSINFSGLEKFFFILFSLTFSVLIILLFYQHFYATSFYQFQKLVLRNMKCCIIDIHLPLVGLDRFLSQGIAISFSFLNFLNNFGGLFELAKFLKLNTKLIYSFHDFGISTCFACIKVLK